MKKDSLTTFQKMKFSEMAVKSKKGIKPERLPPIGGSARQYSLELIYKSHAGKHY